MARNSIKGTGVALVTPFTTSGEVDWQALERLLNHQLDGGVDFLCILATTGETPCLTSEEKEGIKQVVLAQVAGRVPVVLGFGGNNTAELLRQLQQTNLSGFDALLSVCPYYNKPSQEGLYRHFRTLAEASPLPLILYNVPARTGVNLQAATTLRLANDCPSIVAIKEASGDLEQIQTILRNKPDGFDVLSGDDALTLPMLKEGAVGVISVIANALPHPFGLDMVHKALEGDYTSAEATDLLLQPLYSLLTRDGNPAGVKALLHALDLANATVRLPLVEATPATAQAIASAVQSLRL